MVNTPPLKDDKPPQVLTLKMKWAVIIVASILLLVSTLYRLVEGKEADSTLTWLFTVVAGLVYGANIIEKFTKK